MHATIALLVAFCCYWAHTDAVAVHGQLRSELVALCEARGGVFRHVAGVVTEECSL